MSKMVALKTENNSLKNRLGYINSDYGKLLKRIHTLENRCRMQRRILHNKRELINKFWNVVHTLQALRDPEKRWDPVQTKAALDNLYKFLEEEGGDAQIGGSKQT